MDPPQAAWRLCGLASRRLGSGCRVRSSGKGPRQHAPLRSAPLATAALLYCCTRPPHLRLVRHDEELGVSLRACPLLGLPTVLLCVLHTLLRLLGDDVICHPGGVDLQASTQHDPQPA